MFKFSRVCMAAMGLFAANAASADTVIDLFDVLQAPVTASAQSNPGPNWSQVGPYPTTSIFSGYRDLGVGFTSAISSSDTPASIGVVSGIGPGAGNNFLSISNDAGVASTAVVRWDGATAGTGAVDLASLRTSIDKTGTAYFLGTAADFFEVLVISSDLGFQFTFEIYTSASQWSSITFVANAYNESFPGTVAQIPLAGFLDCLNMGGGPTTTCGAGGAADLSNVRAMQLVVNPFGGQADIDLRLNQITTRIPEPGSLALVGVGLLGAVGLGSKRRRRVG